MNITRRFFLGVVLFLAVALPSWATTYYKSTTAGNWSAAASWDLHDNEAGGDGPPTNGDDVIFNANSAACTIDTATCVCKTAVFTGYTGILTHTAAMKLTVSGDLTMVAGMTYTLGSATTSALTIDATAALNTGGKTIGNFIYNKVGGTLTLTADVTCSGSWTNTAGALAGNFAVILTGATPTITPTAAFSFYNLTRTGNAVKTDTLSLAGNITVTNALSLNGNSSSNRVLVTSSTIGTPYAITTGGAITLTNVDFRDIAFQSTNARTISSAASDGATGTRFLTAAAHGLVAGMNVMIAGTGGLYDGTHAIINVSDTTHYDIATAYSSSTTGTWTHDFSTVALAPGGVGGGVCSGLVGLTPNVARTLYYHEAEAGANNFSTVGKWFDATNGGGTVSTTPPLMQDTAKFNADSFDAGSKVVTQDMPRIGSVDWTGATNIPTWTTSTAASCYGSITLITATTGMILTATTQIYTLEGRGSYTITSAGNSWAKVINLNVPGGTITLQDSYSSSASLTIDQGTLTTNSNVTIASLSYNTILTGTVTLNLGAGTWTITSAPTLAWKLGTGTLTIGSITNNTIKFTDTSATTKAFWGRGKVYNNIWYAPGAGTGEFDIADGANTFADFKDDGSAAHSIKFTKSTTTTVASWNVGTASSRAGNTNVITLDTVDGAGTFLINQSVAGKVCATSLNITRSVANGAGVTWYAGATPPSVNGGTNTGWTFGGCAAGRKTLLGVGP